MVGEYKTYRVHFGFETGKVCLRHITNGEEFKIAVGSLNKVFTSFSSIYLYVQAYTKVDALVKAERLFLNYIEHAESMLRDSMQEEKGKVEGMYLVTYYPGEGMKVTPIQAEGISSEYEYPAMVDSYMDKKCFRLRIIAYSAEEAKKKAVKELINYYNEMQETLKELDK